MKHFPVAARRGFAGRFRSPRVEWLEERINLAAASYDLGALVGSDGFVLNGADILDLAGGAVSSAGDFNGDGFDDYLIGADLAESGGNRDAGETYVVFGKAGGFAASFELDTLDGTNGFRFNGIDQYDRSGSSVSSAGDINGDGFDDLLISALDADPGGNSGAGESYIFFGTASSVAASVDLSSLNGTNGFVLNGIDPNDRSGISVSGAGDVNGDGFADFMIGADMPDADEDSGFGETYVVFGHAGSYPASFDLATLDGSNGFMITGVDPRDRSGFSVSSAGDVNGDGFSDLIIGAISADPGDETSAGEAYIVFGKSEDFGASFDLGSLDGSNGITFTGDESFDTAGISVSTAGDLNGDGFDDVIIGAPGADPGGVSAAGESYVFFGKAGGFAALVDLPALNGTDGFVIEGINVVDRSGTSVRTAGDVNGDGYDDLVIGATRGNSSTGEAYVVLGMAGGFAASLDLSTLNGTNGFDLHGIDVGDFAGADVSSAGDVNGDGFDDVLVGALSASPNGRSNAGETYLFFGRDFTNAVTLAGDDTANLLTGSAAVDKIIAGQDDDTLIGGGGADVLRGGQGDDRIQVGDAGFFRVNGGNGIDVLEVGAFDLDLTAIADNKLVEIEEIDLATAAGGQTLTLDRMELLNLSWSSNTLVVHGTAADSIEPGTGWSLAGTEVIGPETYTVLTQGAATLKFDADMGTVGPVLAGDANGDDSVDALDANIVSLNWLDFPAGGATLADGDANGDGHVDALDANILSLNWLSEITATGSDSAYAQDVATEAAVDQTLIDLIALNFLRFRSGGATQADGDVNGDGRVDGLDIHWLWAGS